MKVSELIAYLKELDQDAEVEIENGNEEKLEVVAITEKHEKIIRMIGEVEEINSVIIECQ